MRNVKYVTVRWTDRILSGHYYDPAEKVEGDGDIVENRIPLGDTTVRTVKRVYKIDKDVIRKYGTSKEDE